MIINFKGQTLETKHWYDLSELKCLNIKNEYYALPDKDKVIENFIKIHNGGVKYTDIQNYFVKDLMSKVKLYHSKWSIEDVFECNDLIRFFYSKTIDNKKIYPETHSMCKKIETAFRLGGKGVASKPSNFPIQKIDYILQNYNVNNNYYDYSCGWGVRLLSSLRNNINYYGTDPNYLLTHRLNEMGKSYNKINKTNRKFNIYTQGSEVFIPELENKIGLCFSSPPYFGLEDYKIGNQSYTNGITYDNWLNVFLKNTMNNCKRYLINNGYLLVNINDYDKYKLYEDTKQLCLNLGFEFIEELKLDNIKRAKSSGGFNDNSEGILVFRKS